MLLSLLADINSGGRQVMGESPEPMITSLERTQPIHRLAMNAVAILLICHNEVVAVTTLDHGISIGPVTSLALNLLDLAEQEAKPMTESDYTKAGILGFLVVPNPERPRPTQALPEVWKKHPTAQYMAVPLGKSSWKAVQENQWSQM
jgi:hypothetical protein